MIAHNEGDNEKQEKIYNIKNINRNQHTSMDSKRRTKRTL